MNKLKHFISIRIIILDTGYREVIQKLNNRLIWIRKQYLTFFQFVPFDKLPPDEGWLQSLNWIYK